MTDLLAERPINEGQSTMTEKEGKAALKAGMSGSWQSEPMLGSIYGEEEIDAVV